MDLEETHILGAKTSQTVVRAHDRDPRSWLSAAPICAALVPHRIAHVGYARAAAPYKVVRMKQSGTYFMMCVRGEGLVLVDGRWHECKAGTACLLPPHSLNAFQCVKGKPWEFAWVRYEAVPETRPISRASSPVVAKHAGQALPHAVLGLHAELNGLASPAAVHHWVELIQMSVLRFAQPFDMDDRVAAMLEKVAKRPGDPWTLESMASECHVSKEHLRRLCQQQLGRSPMRQLTHLRMRMAATLLADTNEKIETIARRCGYQNPFVFSTTFKKWVGWRPSEHRGRK